MKALFSVLGALVRPRRAFDSMGDAARWVWIIPLLLLAGSAVAKGAVNAPLVFAEQQAAIQEQFMGSEPVEIREEVRAGDVVIEEAMPPEEEMEVVSTIATTSAVVFAGIGTVVSVLLTGLFFFIAAKVSAKEPRYAGPLTVASVMMLPHAIRNAVQTLYIVSTGSALNHAGLGALVAPANIMDAPSLSYAVLSQIDLWVLWGLVILFGGLTSALVGLERKRALTAFTAFVAIVFVMQAIPTIVQGAFMGVASG